jgi:hypothetical protein
MSYFNIARKDRVYSTMCFVVMKILCLVQVKMALTIIFEEHKETIIVIVD